MRLWMKLIRGTEHPDLVAADAEIYSTYESGLQENQRYTDAKLGGLGFETLKYKSATIVFDGAATGLTGAYFLNTKYLKFEVYSGRNFEQLGSARTVSGHGCNHHGTLRSWVL